MVRRDEVKVRNEDRRQNGDRQQGYCQPGPELLVSAALLREKI